MKQADLDRAVADATGETVSTIKRLGFLLAHPIDNSDPVPEESAPNVIEQDELDTRNDQEGSHGYRHEPAVA